MPIRIKKLNCRVTVKVGGKKPALHQDAKPAKLSMSFAMAMPQPKLQSQPEPSQTATEERDAGAGSHQNHLVQQADARAVADRVYALMKEELALARQRNGR